MSLFVSFLSLSVCETRFVSCLFLSLSCLFRCARQGLSLVSFCLSLFRERDKERQSLTHRMGSA